MRFRPTATAVVVLALVSGFLVAAALPSRAAAKQKPCWVRVQDDWLNHGVITGHYSVRCLQQAQKNLHEDLRDYTNIGDAIDAAIQAALRGGKHTNPSGGNTIPGSGGPGTTPADKPRVLQNAPPRSYYRRAIDSLGTTSAESLPIPLLVLAGLGTALLLSAAGLAARKRLRARRPTPPA